MDQKFSIPPENFTSFVASALCELTANQYVLVEAVKHIHAQFFQENEEQTRAYFDALYEKAQVESIARYYSKYGVTRQ